MSHTLSVTPSPLLFSVQMMISDYNSGGETVSKSEVQDGGLGSLKGVFLQPIPAGQNSLNAVLFPIVTNGHVILARLVTGVFQEIPTTIGLNAVMNAIVCIG